MEVLYELWLQSICNFEPERVEKAVVLFENKGKKFSSPESDMHMLKKLGIAKELEKKLADPETFRKAKEIADYCEKNQIRIITQDSNEYPEILKHITTPPRVLYAKGEKLDLDDRLAISVVGTRKPTAQGRNAARRIGKKLAENGIMVVSGMAEGIDGEAQFGALEGGGKTIAVLAGSVDAIYPKVHTRLYYDILKNGTVLSERPPGTVVRRYFYQQRNRIVVGLTQGTVVVEGEEHSGTSITARLALENNRDIFAVPGNPVAIQSALPNRLISEGAEIMNRLEVPIEYYRENRPDLFEKTKPGRPVSDTRTELAPDDAAIVDFILKNGGIADGEELAENLKMAPAALGSKLMILCIRGILRQESGNRYMVVEID